MNSNVKFLIPLNPSDNAWIQHRFLKVVRSGAPGSDDPEVVLARVKEMLFTESEQDRAKNFLTMFAESPLEVLALAAHNIARQKLSPEEKRRGKEQYRRRYLSQQPPTERQHECLRNHGYSGPIQSKQHASDLINYLGTKN